MNSPQHIDHDTREKLEALFQSNGYSDFKWMDPREVVVAQWVRMKCTFGCDEYGKSCCCPPNTPTVPECERFFREYRTGVIFRFRKTVDKPEDRHQWSKGVNMKLSRLERDVFLAGFEKTFMLFMDSCTFCETCTADPPQCPHPQIARPAPEAMAVDVFSTVKKYGYPIQVKTGYEQEMNRFAFLLVE